MRLSVDKNDPGYGPEALNHIAILDGEHVPLAITADEEEGYVLEWLTGEDGKPRVDGNTHPITRERRGGVRLQRIR